MKSLNTSLWFHSFLIVFVLFMGSSALAQENNGLPVYRVITTPSSEINFPGPSEKAGTSGPGLVAPAKTGPAPPLTSVSILGVYSTLYGGWEIIPSGRLGTVGHHGGNQMRVAVQEIGYGGTPTAYMAGAMLPPSKNYYNELICIVGGRYDRCPAGYTVVGFRRYFNLDGYQIGPFSYQNTSLNYPWNTKSTFININ